MATPNSGKPGNPGPGKAAKASKPPVSKPAVSKPAKPGDGLLGWLGRQVGHVKKAVKTDVTKPPPAGGTSKSPTAEPQPAQPAPPAPDGTLSPTVIYRDDKIEEVDHPTRPGVKLRRRVIDEVIVEPERTGPDAQP